jgi:four helix bundle protein
LSWEDASRLLKDRKTLAISDQLYRATANISSNIAEGYSRGTGKDRARFYEYALGSAREASDWYYKGRHVLSAEVMAHRLDLLTQIIKLTLSMTGKERLINRRIVEA